MRTYVWIVMDGGWGTNILKVFDNEKAARKFASDNATSFAGFDGDYSLPVTKKEVEA